MTNWRTYGRESGNCRPCLLLYNIARDLERDGVVTELTTDTPVHCAKMLILWEVQEYESKWADTVNISQNNTKNESGKKSK